MHHTILSRFKSLWKEILLFLVVILLTLYITYVPFTVAEDSDSTAEEIKKHVSGGVITIFRNELWSI